MSTIQLKKGRERSLARRHPWVFSGAIAKSSNDFEPGDLVQVVGSDGTFLAWGYANPNTQIVVRVLDWNESATIDGGWWRNKLANAIDRRLHNPVVAQNQMRRLCYAEADGVPGLIVDQYGDVVVLQALTAGIERVKKTICDTLIDILDPQYIYERSDTDTRKLEGLQPVAGSIHGGNPPKYIDITQDHLEFQVDVTTGHKTGFYLDQFTNRSLVARYVKGKHVLDLFSYTGACGLYAMAAGAESVTMIESSRDALDATGRHIEGNHLGAITHDLVQGNVFEVLRSYRDARRSFDVVIVDPPKFAHTKAQRNKAERAYKDVNLLALKLLTPGGVLATFSCSSAIDRAALLRIVSWASLDAGRDVRVLHQLSQSPDHPISPSFPESEYLCGFVCVVS